MLMEKLKQLETLRKNSKVLSTRGGYASPKVVPLIFAMR